MALTRHNINKRIERFGALWKLDVSRAVLALLIKVQERSVSRFFVTLFGEPQSVGDDLFVCRVTVVVSEKWW